MGTLDRSPYLDWADVTDPVAENALRTLLTEKRMRDRWFDLSKEAQSVHRSILESFIQRAQPLTPQDISELGLPNLQAKEVLEELNRRDLIVFRQGIIKSAYPFSASETLHSVEVAAIRNWAVCVIDALGTAAMVRKAAIVRSSCPICGKKLKIRMTKDGLSAYEINPSTVTIWAGVAETDGCAADTQCQSMLAFCTVEHLEEWKPEGAIGFRLSPRQAIQVGAAVFKPFF